MADVSMDPTQDLLSQIAQRLQPVVPTAPGFYTPTLAERQAAINAAQGGANAYGGSVLSTPTPQSGPVAPTVNPGAALSQQASMTPGQLDQLVAQQRAVFLTKYPGQEQAAMNITPQTALRQAQNNMATGYTATGALSPESQAALKAQVMRNMLAKGQPYTGGGTWDPRTNTYKPGAVEQSIGHLNQVGPTVYHGNALTPWGQAYKQAYRPTTDQVKQMVNRPDLAQSYVNKSQAGAQRVEDTTARQQQYLKLQAMRNAAQRSGAGQFDQYLMPAMKLAMGFL